MFILWAISLCFALKVLDNTIAKSLRIVNDHLESRLKNWDDYEDLSDSEYDDEDEKNK